MIKVKLNPYLTPELVIEGWVNEFKRAISIMRKELGLKHSDVVKCVYLPKLTYKDAVDAANNHNLCLKQKKLENQK